MHIFRESGQVLTPLKELRFNSEKQIQKLTETNLETVFQLELVKHEFRCKDFRVDTLAFDPSDGAFVIIEYKRTKSSGIIDQGEAYRQSLLEHKADAVLEYNRSKTKSLQKEDINWKKTRVLFIAHEFTPHQIAAVGSKSQFQLWEIRVYTDYIVSFTRIPEQRPVPIASLEQYGDHQIKEGIRNKVIAHAARTQALATLTINPASAAVGTKIQISGSGFAANSVYTMTFGGIARTMESTALANTSGDLINSFVVPNTPGGAYVVVLTDYNGNTAAAVLTVIPRVARQSHETGNT